jgi:hypothetical protein
MGVIGSTSGTRMRSVVTMCADAIAGLATPVRLSAVLMMVSCCSARV